MRYILLILVFLTSCDIQRQVSKTNTDTDTKEILEKSSIRRGDSVSYKTVLHIKDTTIYTINRQGTTLKTVYNSEGNVSQIDCYSSAIADILKYTKDMQQTQITKDKDEGFKMSDTLIICLAIAFCFVMYIKK